MWINNSWCIHTTRYYSTIKNNELVINKTTWVNLWTVMQNEVHADGIAWNLSSCTRIWVPKDKLREQESRHVFHIANQKGFQVKDKAKLVATDLKEINTVNDEKVNRGNKAFLDIQKEVAHTSQRAFLLNLSKNSWFLSKVMNTNQLMLMKLQVWWHKCSTTGDASNSPRWPIV